MRSLLAIALFAAIIGLSSAINVQNATQFLLGFGDGLEIDFTGKNISACIADEEADFEDFETGFTDLDMGIKKLSLSLIQSGLVSFGAGVQELGAVLQQCDMGQIADDVATIAKQIESGGIFEVIVKEAVDIFYHRTSLLAEFKAATAAWKAGEWFTAGQNVGEIVGVLLQE